MINTISICGQKFTPAIVDKINQIVEQTKELTRRKLSIIVCELVKILGASPEAFEFPDLKIEGTKQASGN